MALPRRSRRLTGPTASAPEAAGAADPKPGAPKFRWPGLAWPTGLSARLLLLTAAFVLGAELLTLAPSLAAYQDTWLTSRVRAAELASLAVEAAPAGVVSDRMAGELLEGAGVVSVAVQVKGVRRLLLQAPRMARFPALIDLRQSDPVQWLLSPFQMIAPGGAPMLRVIAKPQFRGGDFVEIVVSDAPLRHDLIAYATRLLLISVMISLVAGMIVYLALNAFLVRPMRRIVQSMERFRAAPEDPAARLKLSGRRDEIGRAEAELGRMQEDLRTALQSRSRLAALGEAVAKINHDLRNMLTSAQVVAERLQGVGDPRVALALPRLERALDRAVRLAQNVMAYGRSEEAAPLRREVALAPAAQVAAEDAGLTPESVSLALDLPLGFAVSADPEQLDRILVNLLKNAREAIEATGRSKGLVRLSARAEAGEALIDIRDDGPGVPERLRERLFQPFAGSGRPDGAGLGLAIARELARAHGGELTLEETGPEGSRFLLRLPSG